jgi:hypothetical protein
VKTGKSVILVRIPRGAREGRYILVTSGVKDLEGNTILDKTISFTIPSPYAKMAKEVAQAIDYTNPTTRDYAIQLAALCPGKYSICQVCKIYDYLFKNWRYVSDPNGLNYVSPASRTIQANLAGDCDDYAVLMAAVIAAIGGTPRVIIAWGSAGGHAYAEVFVGDEANLNDVADWIRDYYRDFLARLFGIDLVGPINYHKEASGDCWLNLDWSSKYPGGPFFEATRAIAVSLDGTYRIIKGE